jgi:hypothetical protein
MPQVVQVQIKGCRKTCGLQRRLPDPVEVPPPGHPAQRSDEQTAGRAGLGEVLQVVVEVRAQAPRQADRPLARLRFGVGVVGVLDPLRLTAERSRWARSTCRVRRWAGRSEC